MTKTYLYHIHRKEDKGNLKVGYIGITVDTARRWKRHKHEPVNEHLGRALKKYDDIEFTIISEGSNEEMLRMENWLRPTNNIGWNVGVGGIKTLLGHKWSRDTQARRTASIRLAYEEGRISMHTENRRIANRIRHLREFVLYSPDMSERIQSDDLIQFCEDRNFGNHNMFMRVLSGEREQNNGWTGFYTDTYDESYWINNVRNKNKFFIAVSPSGEKHYGRVLAEFEKEMSIPAGCLSAVARGTRNTYRKWKAEYIYI